MKIVTHGTTTGYARGCRCDECKLATSEYKRRYYQSNREKISEMSTRRYWEELRGDSDYAAKRHGYYLEHKERILARSKKWREENRDKWIESSRRSYVKNRESGRARSRRYREANSEAIRERNSRYRARRAAVPTVPFTSDQLEQRWSMWGAKCWMCEAPATATDHVKPIIAGGAHMLCNLRPICMPCNSSKQGKWPIAGMMGRSHHTPKGDRNG